MQADYQIRIKRKKGESRRNSNLIVAERCLSGYYFGGCRMLKIKLQLNKAVE